MLPSSDLNIDLQGNTSTIMVDFSAIYVRVREGSNCKNVLEYLPCLHTTDWDTSHVDPYGEGNPFTSSRHPVQSGEAVDARNIRNNNQRFIHRVHIT